MHSAHYLVDYTGANRAAHTYACGGMLARRSVLTPSYLQSVLLFAEHAKLEANSVGSTT